MKKYIIRILPLLLLIGVLSANPCYAANGDDIVIAVLDTGVDSSHPALINNLLPGINLIHSDKPAIDGNGHGTGVAGILVAEYQAKILPIKVLDDQGAGESSLLAKGIQHAVQKGAKIILLSLGDPIYWRELELAIKSAEQQGALVIAAAGNDAGRVTYPGVFPTVLTVGAVDGQNQVLSYSNRGPELDLVAPGNRIKTTGLNGTFTEKSGTSFAAPQVAGIAALLLAENPSLTPRELRLLLKATARDLGPEGWDANTGFGMVDRAKAIQNAHQGMLDPFEPNNTQSSAAPLSFEEQIGATLNKEDVVDWYRVSIPYDGRFQFQVNQKGLQLELIDTANKKWFGEQALSVKVNKGTIWIKVSHAGVPRDLKYWLTTQFEIAEDDYESNDSRDSAVALPVSPLVKWTGNFHREQDQDWYSLAVPYAGKGELELTVDSLRIDPVIGLEQEGKWRTEVDKGSVGNGQKESWNGSLSPGHLFVGIREYYGNAENAEYHAQFRYMPSPSPYFKDITTHWARKEIEALASKKVISGYTDGTFQPNRTVTRAEVAAIINSVGGGSGEASRANLLDVPKSHWGYSAIASLVDKGIIEPIGGLVRPDKPITRAELATWLSKAKFGVKFPASLGKSPSFEDLPVSHEAYPYVRKLWQNQLISGVSDREFGPDQLATRAQLASLVKRIWY